MQLLPNLGVELTPGGVPLHPDTGACTVGSFTLTDAVELQQDAV